MKAICKLKKIYILLCVLFSLSFIVYAALINDIDLENATVNSQWDLIDDKTYDLEKVGNEWSHFTEKPAISSWTKNGSGSSLKFEVNATTNNSTKKQRTEYDIKKNLPFDSWRYLGLELAIHPDSDTPLEWTTFTQFQQYPKPVGASPPGALQLEIGEGYEIRFVVRNTQYYAIDGQAGPLGKSLTVWSKVISENEWYDLVIGFKPDGSEGTNSGAVKIWWNGQLELDWTGDVGQPSTVMGQSWAQKYKIKTGIYRKTQNANLRYHIDNYKLGTTYADVAPGGGSPPPPPPSGSPSLNTNYFVVNKSSNLVATATTTSGSSLFLQDQGDFGRRKWKLRDAGNGNVYIENKSGLVAKGNGNGTDVVLASKTSTNSKKWELLDAGGGFYYIENVANGYVWKGDGGLDDEIVVSTQSTADSRKWKFVLSGGTSLKADMGAFEALDVQPSDIGIYIYPNPTNNVLSIEMPLNINVSQVSIFTMSGLEVSSQNLNGTHLESIDISGLDAGIYLVILNTSKGKVSKKLIVE